MGLLTFAFISLTVAAGTWGSGSFDNDDALDWLDNEFVIDGASAIERAINAVIRSSRDLDLTTAASAVAACEFVAAWQGRPSKDIPESILAEARTLRGAPGEDLRERARKALDMVAKDSELQALWAEGDEAEYEKWRKAIEDSKARL